MFIACCHAKSDYVVKEDTVMVTRPVSALPFPLALTFYIHIRTAEEYVILAMKGTPS